MLLTHEAQQITVSMSQMLAPYNSGMRIGTGFNSYTQQLCVNNAVVKENKDPATVADLRPQGTEELSQTVKWSGRFVENASDVLDSLDISGMSPSLSN